MTALNREQVIKWAQECDIRDLGNCFVDNNSLWIAVDEQREVHYRFVAYKWPVCREVINENIH